MKRLAPIASATLLTLLSACGAAPSTREAGVAQTDGSTTTSSTTEPVANEEVVARSSVTMRQLDKLMPELDLGRLAELAPLDLPTSSVLKFGLEKAGATTSDAALCLRVDTPANGSGRVCPSATTAYGVIVGTVDMPDVGIGVFLIVDRSVNVNGASDCAFVPAGLGKVTEAEVWTCVAEGPFEVTLDKDELHYTLSSKEFGVI
jgi:hypothetical protein